MRVFLLSVACVVGVAAHAAAAPRQIALAPPASEVGFRIYGLGLLPFDGAFSRFHGTLSYDPDDHTKCQVELVADVDSLAMNGRSVRETVVGPEFMDASRFPMLAFTGACDSDRIGGMLTLHGVTRPFELKLDWSQDRVTAQGRLRRAEWGMTARPIVGGRTVRIRVTVPLPRPGQ